MAVEPMPVEDSGSDARKEDDEEQGRVAADQNSATSNLFRALDRQGEKAPFIKEASELIPQIAVLDAQEAVEALYKFADGLTRQGVPESLRKNVNAFISQATAFAAMIAALTPNAALAADEIAAQYGAYKVDKTGIIGGAANVIEMGIDLAHSGLEGAGLTNAYGISICLFTLLVKTITLPLTKTSIESAAKLQQLAPFSQEIQSAFPGNSDADQQRKGQLTMQLYQAADVNPLNGIVPSLVQIPVFISFYRALQNLEAQDKLEEPFLWLPNLEGPVYASPPGETLGWFTSIFSGNPTLGWEDTVAFLSLPAALWVSQTVSQRILRPPRDPSKQMTDQEAISQGIIDNLPFVVAFFSLNAPAGLGIYWLANNILTTVITLLVKANVQNVPVTGEVEKVMALVDQQSSKKKSKSVLRPITGSNMDPNGRGFSSSSLSSRASRRAEGRKTEAENVTVRIKTPESRVVDAAVVDSSAAAPSTIVDATVVASPDPSPSSHDESSIGSVDAASKTQEKSVAKAKKNVLKKGKKGKKVRK
jgi:YidC/Oxa1 family membrane protein insertase